MVTYIVCVRVLVYMYTESFQVLYFPSHFRGGLAFASGTVVFLGCSGIEALKLNLFQRIYSLFILGKGNASEKYIVLLKGGVPSFFLVAIVLLY